MQKKKVILVIFCLALLVIAAVVIDATSQANKPSKYQGLKLGTKIDSKKLRTPPCEQYGCGPWHTVVGDKDSKKAYRCGCFIPSTFKKAKSVCFMSVSAAKKVAYREEQCKR